MPEAPERISIRAVRVFREAQSRAQNVAHDLDDLEWIDQTDEQVRDSLVEIQREATVLLRQLQELTGHHELPESKPDARCRACDLLVAECLCEFGPQVDPTQPPMAERGAIPLAGDGPGEAD